MYSTVQKTIETIVRDKEAELATELRIVEATLEREQSALDLTRLEAGYRRKHPVRSRLIGTPMDVKPAPADVALWALKPLSAASATTKARLAPVFRGRALTVADALALRHIAELDWDASVYREMDALLGSAPETPPLAHPLFTQWQQAISRADELPRTRAEHHWILSTTAGGIIVGGFFLSAAATILAITGTSSVSPILAMGAMFGLGTGAIIYAVLRDRPTRFADWPEDLADRCVALRAYAEAARLVQWHSDGTLSRDDIGALNRCLDARESMAAFVNAAGSDEISITTSSYPKVRSRRVPPVRYDPYDTLYY